MKLSAVLSAAALSLGMAGFVSADITGKVTFEGKAPARKKLNIAGVPQCAAKHPNGLMDESLIVDPKTKGIANVVVSLKNAPAGKPSSEPVVIDQKGCEYVPHIVAVQVGQKILVRNDDEFMHNIHGLPQDNAPFNFAQNQDKTGKALSPASTKTEEYYPVKCDVHPWMSARVAVLPNQYFAVTKEDGTFEIKTEGLKDGDYDVHFWHEKLGEADGKVTVKGGKGEVKPITMKPEDEGDAGKISPFENTELVSITTKACPNCK